MKSERFTLGIDIGSTTVKIAVLDAENRLLFADYKRHFANIRETLADLLKEVYETTGIKAEGDKIVCDNPEVEAWAKPESNVSMNMWAGYPDFLDYLEKDFSTFLSNISDNPMKKEYLLPNIVAE